MTIETDGTFSTPTASQLRTQLIASLREQFGSNVDVTPTSTLRKMIEAAFSLPLLETFGANADVYRQMFVESATGGNLDKAALPFGFVRGQSTKSTGVVTITFNTALSSPPEPSPWIPSSHILFVDTAGRTYRPDIDLDVNGTDTLDIQVTAQFLGSAGNIDASSIVGVTFSNGASQTLWNDNVSSFTNNAAFAGGQDTESDSEFRERIRESASTGASASVDGITSALLATSGVNSATVLENATLIGTSTDKVFDSDETGTASEQIDATTPYLAQKVVITESRWVQHFNCQVTHVSGTPTYDVTFESDNSGAPFATETLVSVDMKTTGFQPADGSVTAGVFDEGAFVPAGTYWLVFTRTAGDATFDGGTGGTADQVVIDTDRASWAADANIENANMEVIGGVPPKAFRAYVDGGANDDIAQTIWDTRAAGIYADGVDSGTATDLGGLTHTQMFERPTLTDVVVSITVTFSTSYTGDGSDVKDALVEYIGGTDTGGTSHSGTGVAEKIVRNEMIARVLEDDVISGLVDVTVCRVGRKSEFATPAALTAGQEANLIADVFETFRVSDVANDIEVTLVAD